MAQAGLPLLWSGALKLGRDGHEIRIVAARQFERAVFPIRSFPVFLGLFNAVLGG